MNDDQPAFQPTASGLLVPAEKPPDPAPRKAIHNPDGSVTLCREVWEAITKALAWKDHHRMAAISLDQLGKLIFEKHDIDCETYT